MIEFGRAICGDLVNAERREWLVTNGIGGFASGTIAGTLTRRYHGLLLAALHPPNDRFLLVTKFDETATYAGASHPLHTNNWINSTNPNGYQNIERFFLDGTSPVWHYALADAVLEKRIWMQPGANTTYVQYTLLRASAPLQLTTAALVNYRSHHSQTQADGWKMQVEQINNGLEVLAFDDAIPFYIFSDRAIPKTHHEWYFRFHLPKETYRGLPAFDDNLCVGHFGITLQQAESFILVASVEAKPNLDGAAAYALRQTHEADILARFEGQMGRQPLRIQQLALAADQFIVSRPIAKDINGRSIIAGYHWFGDWGRDTMIALPGLTLTTGRPEIAAKILRTFSFYEKDGLLPNRFPEIGMQPEYNTVDAALWYVEAVRAYHAAVGDDEFVRQLFPVLTNIISHYQQGTRFNIRMDPEDSLLYAGETGQQLTWMDAKVGDWVVTPRVGKPVEINALWYNALCIMRDFARILGQDPVVYAQMAEYVRRSFGRFWLAEGGYCFDVLDTPNGNDSSLRPNQLLAVSLPHSPLTAEQQKAIVDRCGQTLLSSYGLRSLAPEQTGYIGCYGGDPYQRDSAYHQGAVWGWLMGPFVRAHLRVYNDKAFARSYLEPLLDHLADHGLGSISEIFDGGAPFTPRGAIAQAWSVAELLATWQLTEHDGPAGA